MPTEDLVLALCHEIGNLVSAIRLNAHLIDGEMSPVGLATASLEIDDSSSRIRSLLALVRPLLEREQGPGVDVAELLEGVAEALDEYGGRAVKIEVRPAPALPRVVGRKGAVHHLILSLAYHALEEAGPGGHVAVEAEPRDDAGVVVRVVDDGPEEMGLGDVASAPPTGRRLVCAIGNGILGSLGGAVTGKRVAETTTIEIFLPAC